MKNTHHQSILHRQMMRRTRKFLLVFLLPSFMLLSATQAESKDRRKKGEKDDYAGIVWPPPPDKAYIKLEEVITGRKDVEGGSKLKKMLIGIENLSPYDQLNKPFGVAIDKQSRIQGSLE